jgi:hypothetical protein
MDIAKPSKTVKKPKPPTQLIVSDERKQHMQARMKSEEASAR